eukprot:2739659-Amphidinium_carterae.1
MMHEQIVVVGTTSDATVRGACPRSATSAGDQLTLHRWFAQRTMPVLINCRYMRCSPGAPGADSCERDDRLLALSMRWLSCSVANPPRHRAGMFESGVLTESAFGTIQSRVLLHLLDSKVQLAHALLLSRTYSRIASVCATRLDRKARNSCPEPRGKSLLNEVLQMCI